MNKLEKLLNIKIDCKVKGITLDSRAIKEGFIFVALKGEKFDGNDFIEKAFSNGAKLVLSDNREGDNIFKISGLKEKLPEIAEIIYPNLPEKLIAVTGTNGKTSVVNFTCQILRKLGAEVASFGTLGFFINKELIEEVPNTSPDILTFRRNLALAYERKVKYAVFEASSHALILDRIKNISVDVACFTNLTQDHLDFHQNMENYFIAKSLLFSENLKENAKAVINSDSEYKDELFKIVESKKANILDYGRDANFLKLLQVFDGGFEVLFDKKKYNIDFNLVGEFQIYNLLASFAIIYALEEFSMGEIFEVSQAIKEVRGRLERVGGKNIFVDYAHTPDALENILKSVREIFEGRVILIFGCGGDRDKEKRALMGEVADKYSDLVIVSDDNPRNEDPAQIRQSIMKRVKNAKEIADRREAIKYGISEMQDGDVVLVAGKGHEAYQIIGDKKEHFDDKEVILEILS